MPISLKFEYFQWGTGKKGAEMFKNATETTVCTKRY